MLYGKDENFFLSCYCLVFLLSSALCEEQCPVGVMWFIRASVVCMCMKAEERWMESRSAWLESGGECTCIAASSVACREAVL